MSKITVNANNTFTIESAFSTKELAKAKAGRPESLKLYEGDGENKKLIFSVGTGCASLNGNGMSFESDSLITGKAVYTDSIPAGTVQVKEYVADKVGFAKIHLDVIEAQVAVALRDIATDRANVLASIDMPVAIVAQ